MSSAALQQWQREYDASNRGLVGRVDELFPEPLYESAAVSGERLCFLCGDRRARTALMTPSSAEPVVPLCRECSAEWNMYGFRVLRRIRPAALLLKVVKWSIRHPARRAAVWGDLRRLRKWKRRVDELRKQAREDSR
jgi:hypothetical protein